MESAEDDLNSLSEVELLKRLAENTRRLEIIGRFRRDLSSARTSRSRPQASASFRGGSREAR